MTRAHEIATGPSSGRPPWNDLDELPPLEKFRLNHGRLRKGLLNTIRTVHRAGKAISAEVAEELAQHVLDEKLTERELAILKRVAIGTSNKEIAAAANDRTHAVMIAIKRGFIDG